MRVLSNPQIVQATTPKINGYIRQLPTPKQRAFMLLNGEEAFYGGAAGPGKSTAVLQCSLQYVDVPRYSALIVRRTYADLSKPGALMDRAHQWLNGTGARWVEPKKQWLFPGSGAVLSFGYMENERDKYQYQSAEYQYIGVDELTQFTESQYLYLFSRLRRLKGMPVPIRMRSASNPGNIGHDWVKQRFFVEGAKRKIVVIRGLISDNPFLDAEEYERSLMNLDPVTRQQLMRGDWEARQAGGLYRREWFGAPVKEAPREIEAVRYWDRAATRPEPGKEPDYTAGVKLGKTKAGIYYVMHVVRFRGTPLDNEQVIQQTAAIDGTGVEVCMEQEPGSSGVDTIDRYRRVVLPQYKFHSDKVTGKKVERAGPVSSQVQAGNVRLVEGAWIGDFLDELDMWPACPHRDQGDALSGAYNRLARKSKPTMWLG